MKARREGNPERPCDLDRGARQCKGDQQVYDVRVLDRRPEDFFLGLAEGDAVFFYISVEKEKVYFRNADFVLEQRNIRFGTYDFKKVALLFEKMYQIECRYGRAVVFF